MIEYSYHDRLCTDRAIIYIRKETLFTLALNERNVMRATGAGSQYIVVGVAGGGKIRMRWNGDRYWGAKWSTGQGGTGNTEYTGDSLSFDTLMYGPEVANGGGLSVFGRTGNNGVPFNGKYSQFNYACMDPFGDQVHVLTTAHDDFGLTTTDSEWWASDGRMFLFVPEPLTPCLQIAPSDASGQYYTTPLKKHLIPKAYRQATYFQGNVTFNLKALRGETVYYKINDGSWQSGANPILDQNHFAVGENSLQYYYEGNSAHTKVRRVVKNPEHPSKYEPHGFLWAGNSENLARIQAQKNFAPFKSTMDKIRKGNEGMRDEWDIDRRKGLRKPRKETFTNAMLAYLEGVDSKPTARNKTYGEYAKEMLLGNYRAVDMIGWDGNWSQTTQPTREYMYRGYRDCSEMRGHAWAYDMMIACYRSDIHANGITPIEDYFLRDTIACDIHEWMMQMGAWMSWSPPGFDQGGMWDVCRKQVCAISIFALRTYSTEYYGTCGLDGNTQVFFDAPFPGQAITWKEAYLNKTTPLLGFPNQAHRLGIVPQNCNLEGHFTDSVSYWQNDLSWNFAIFANVMRYHYPSLRFPEMELCFWHAARGEMLGAKGANGPARSIQPSMINVNWADIAAESYHFTVGRTSKDPWSIPQLLNGQLPAAMAFYDPSYRPDTPPPINPPIITINPQPATVIEGETISLSITYTGTSPVTLQWRKDGIVIAGATTASLVIPNAGLSDAGNYDCVASNSAGSVTSLSALVNVNEEPTPEPDSMLARSARAPLYAIQV